MKPIHGPVRDDLVETVGAIQKLLDSEDSTGCSPDLTVVGAPACAKLRGVLPKLQKRLDQCVDINNACVPGSYSRIRTAALASLKLDRALADLERFVSNLLGVEYSSIDGWVELVNCLGDGSTISVLQLSNEILATVLVDFLSEQLKSSLEKGS